MLEALGESHLLGHVLDHLGEVEQVRGELDRALHLHRRGCALLEAAGCAERVNTSHYWQGLIAQRRGDARSAVALTVRSLRGYRVRSNRRDLASCLELVAECVSSARPQTAAQLFGAAGKLRKVIQGLPIPPVRRATYADAIARLSAAQGESEFQT